MKTESTEFKELVIAKPRNTAAKRMRDNDKREKADRKRAKRAAKKLTDVSVPILDPEMPESPSIP